MKTQQRESDGPDSLMVQRPIEMVSNLKHNLGMDL